MRALFTGAVTAALWLLVGVAGADDIAAGRAAEFVVADQGAAEVIDGTTTMILLAATGIAVVASVVMILLGGARARRSGALLDRLDSRLEGLDE